MMPHPDSNCREAGYRQQAIQHKIARSARISWAEFDNAAAPKEIRTARSFHITAFVHRTAAAAGGKLCF